DTEDRSKTTGVDRLENSVKAAGSEDHVTTTDAVDRKEAIDAADTEDRSKTTGVDHLENSATSAHDAATAPKIASRFDHVTMHVTSPHSPSCVSSKMTRSRTWHCAPHSAKRPWTDAIAPSPRA